MQRHLDGIRERSSEHRTSESGKLRSPCKTLKAKLLIAVVVSPLLLALLVQPVAATTQIYPGNSYGFTYAESGFGNYNTATKSASATIAIFGEAKSGVGIKVQTGYLNEGIEGFLAVTVRLDYRIAASVFAIGVLPFATASYGIGVYKASLGTAGFPYYSSVKGKTIAGIDEGVLQFVAGSFDLSGSDSLFVGFFAESYTEYYIYAYVRSTCSNGGYGLAAATSEVKFSQIGISFSGGGGGGCPNLLTWDGSRFVDEGVLPIHNYADPDSDMVVYRTLATTPVLSGRTATLKLSEIADGYTFSHSYIDTVKLFAVDERGVRHECPLVFAEHTRFGGVLGALRYGDDRWTETYKGDSITLRFLVMPLFGHSVLGYVFLIEGHNPTKV